MARGYESYIRLKNLVEGPITDTSQESAIMGLPPGYIEGGRLRLTPEYKITISPIIANIKGKQVKRTDTYTVLQEDWLTPQLDGWYYLYLDDAGSYHIDSIAPAYDTDYMSYYHSVIPNYRNIGKLYCYRLPTTTDVHIVFVSSKYEGGRNLVTVAPSTYQGDDADYYCTEIHDERLIQASFDYLHSIGGGRSYVLNGDYDIQATLYPHRLLETTHKAITIEAESWDTIFNRLNNGYLLYIHGENVTIKNLKILEGHDTTTSNLIYGQNCDNALIDHCYLDGNSDHTNIYGAIYFHLSTCENIELSNNYFINIRLVGIMGKITLLKSNTFINCRAAYFLWAEDQGINQGNIIKDCGDGNRDAIGVFSIGTYAIEVSATALTSLGNYAYNNRTPGIFKIKAGSFNQLDDNFCMDNGQLLVGGPCASATHPYIFGDGTQWINALFTCNTSIYHSGIFYGGNASYKLMPSSTGTNVYARFTDNADATDTHTLAQDESYRLSGYCYVSASASNIAASSVGLVFGKWHSATWAFSQYVMPTVTGTWDYIYIDGTISTCATYGAWWGAFMSSASAVTNAEGTFTAYFADLWLQPLGIKNTHSQQLYDVGTQTIIG